ncbi:MAG: putative peptidyl-prolyl cis-trans isomerase precursor PpiB [Bacteroidota bacterium]
MKKIFFVTLLFLTANIISAQPLKKKPLMIAKKPIQTAAALKPSATANGIFATIETTKGDIVLELEYKKTPITVANFVALAEGKHPFVSQELKDKLFYNGLKWHRVIKDFMIQGGDPLGTGSGDPGYKFKDEITDLVHSGSGILSMANSGPGTNGSQFFITHKETSWLNGKHTVFGKVISGQNVVDLIVQNDLIKTIKISRVGADAKAFDAAKTFATYFANKDADAKAEKAKKQAIADEAKKAYRAKFGAVMDAKVAEFTALKASATTSSSGLLYSIKKSNGTKPAPETEVLVHYSGFFEDGSLFQSSYENVSRDFGRFDQNQANANGYNPFPFRCGTKTGMIPGFLEALDLLSYNDKGTFFIPAKIAYAERGAGNLIPPNTNLIFEIELVEKAPTPAVEPPK